jgi:O-antigen ligase
MQTRSRQHRSARAGRPRFVAWNWHARLPSLVLLAFCAVCLLSGGSSRPDAWPTLILRPVAVLSLTALLLLPGTRDWRAVRVPLLLLAAFALAIAVQLVPLPPAAWMALPGHARLAEAAAAAGLAQPWRPISIAPELTLNSLVALIVPATMLVGFARLTRTQANRTVALAIGAMVASAMVGVAQWADTSTSPLFFYHYSNRDLPIGFLANRNHQALFLAMSFPLLRVWAAEPGEAIRDPRIRRAIAALLGMFLFPVILATGSRSGLAIAALALIATWFITPVSLPRWRHISRRKAVLLGLAVIAVGTLGVAVVLSGRAVSVNRLLSMQENSSELRVQFMPLMLRITQDFLPFGSGFGSFDRVFRLYEPLSFLKRTYFNHAHNDVLELVLTGGIPALLVFVGMVIWAGRRFLEIVADRRAERLGSTARLNAAGLVLLLMCLGGSITDYPLRAPWIATMFALACAWVALPRRTASEHNRRDAHTS